MKRIESEREMRKETLKFMSGAFVMAAVLCSGLYNTARSQPAPDPVDTACSEGLALLKSRPVSTFASLIAPRF